jgi:hypothetical protein
VAAVWCRGPAVPRRSRPCGAAAARRLPVANWNPPAPRKSDAHIKSSPLAQFIPPNSTPGRAPGPGHQKTRSRGLPAGAGASRGNHDAAARLHLCNEHARGRAPVAASTFGQPQFAAPCRAPMQTATAPGGSRRLACLAAVALVAIAVNVNHWQGTFVFDDHVAIVSARLADCRNWLLRPAQQAPHLLITPASVGSPCASMSCPTCRRRTRMW